MSKENNSVIEVDPWARFKEMIRIANSRPCPGCGHRDVASDGLCAASVPLIDKEPHGSKRCRCPCVNFVNTVVIPRDNQLNVCDREAGKRLVIDWQRSSGIRLFADQQGWKLERLIAVALATERERCAKIADAFTLEAQPKLITLIAQHNTASTIAETIRNPITQDTASASAPSTTEPDESSVLHEQN